MIQQFEYLSTLTELCFDDPTSDKLIAPTSITFLRNAWQQLKEHQLTYLALPRYHILDNAGDPTVLAYS